MRAGETARPSGPQELQQQLRDLSTAQQPVESQHAQQAQQEAQPALQQPVLALLSSGLPPIVLGTFQGDMQRARIILEAAGFLVPFDISSSLLPPALNSIPPQQHAAVHASPAGLWPHQAAQSAAQEDGYSCEEEEELPVQQHGADLSVSHAQQAASEGIDFLLLTVKRHLNTLSAR